MYTCLLMVLYLFQNALWSVIPKMRQYSYNVGHWENPTSSPVHMELTSLKLCAHVFQGQKVSNIYIHNTDLFQKDTYALSTQVYKL